MIEAIIEKYAQRVVDSMDTDTMSAFCLDVLCERMREVPAEQLLAEIKELHPDLYRELTET